MFIRRIRKFKNNTEYDYWALMKTVRTARGPRQKVVGWIGKTFELIDEHRTIINRANGVLPFSV